MHDDAPTPGEHEALRRLPREIPPHDLLEERTVRALAARGLLHERRRPLFGLWAAAAAACLVFFVAGFGLGTSRSPERRSFPASVLQDSTLDERARRTADVTLAVSDSTTVEAPRHFVWF
jgi:hypothetical protein